MQKIQKFENNLKEKAKKQSEFSDTPFFTERFSSDMKPVRGYFLEYFSTIKEDILNFYYTDEPINQPVFQGQYLGEALDEFRMELIVSPSNFDSTLKVLVQAHFAFRINKMTKYQEKTISSYEDFLKIVNEKERIYWFRGHSKWEYNLIPSMYRDPLKDIDLFNLKRIIDDYTDKGVMRKLNKVFETSGLGYDELAFIQHSIGYSPLLDFTKNPFVSFAFAISDFKDISTFFHHQGAIFMLDVKGLNIITKAPDANLLIEKHEVEVMKGKPYISSIIKSAMWRRLIFGKVESIVHLIDLATNDRMKFQKGTFLLFDQVLIIGNRMLMSATKESFMTTRIIKCTLNKTMALYNDFYTANPEYQSRFLMSPYLYFSE